MAYTREYFLNRVKKVNETYIYWHDKGLCNEYIYKNYIKENFDISRATFYNYLTIPYAKMIKEMKLEKEKLLKQEAEARRMNPTLF